jgi:hypothetical protein
VGSGEEILLGSGEEILLGSGEEILLGSGEEILLGSGERGMPAEPGERVRPEGSTARAAAPEPEPGRAPRERRPGGR